MTAAKLPNFMSEELQTTGWNSDLAAFAPFPKLARLSRPVIITEKLDGTNAQVAVHEDGTVRAGSRTRWITPEDDNYGFAKWVEENKEQLRTLGVGRHFGEWWGAGIQRKYGMTTKQFSLFNATRWAVPGQAPKLIGPAKYQEVLPPCCNVVPILRELPFFSTEDINGVLMTLRATGSQAAPGFMNPEGIVVYHPASGQSFKKTIEKDETPKSLA
jgi:hypothetical protein